MRRNVVIAALVAATLALSACNPIDTPQAAPSHHATTAAPTPTVKPWTAADAKAAYVAGYDIERCGNRTSTAALPKGRIVLSFDDWAYGDPYRAVRIGAELQKRGIRAMFFVIWEFAKRYPDIVRELRQQGHWVENHTVSHPHLKRLSDSAVRYQIRGGTPHANMVRPPYGEYNRRVKDIATALGDLTCTWTIDSNDTDKPGGSYRSAASIRLKIRKAPPSAKRAGMVLGHLFSNYPLAIPGIIRDFEDDGYEFCENTGPVGPIVTYPLAC